MALTSLRSLNATQATLIHKVIREAALNRLQKVEVSESQEQAEPRSTNQTRFNSVLSALSTFGDSVESTEREKLLSELIVIAHHPEACAF
jgi:hypothetical protein